MARVISINISDKKGTFKNPIEMGFLEEGYGLSGDAHGGNWHRQVSLLAKESIEKMKKLGVEGLESGKFGENLTTEGLVLYELPIGTKLKIGEAELQITQIGKECHEGCKIQKSVGKCIMPKEGVFAKVIKSGHVKSGDEIIIFNFKTALAY